MQGKKNNKKNNKKVSKGKNKGGKTQSPVFSGKKKEKHVKKTTLDVMKRSPPKSKLEPANTGVQQPNNKKNNKKNQEPNLSVNGPPPPNNRKNNGMNENKKTGKDILLGTQNEDLLNGVDKNLNKKGMYSDKIIRKALSRYLFENKDIRMRYRQIVILAKCHENMFFLEAVEAYEKISDEDERAALGRFIKDTFIYDGSRLQINLAYRVRNKLSAMNFVNKNDFRECKNLIIKFMVSQEGTLTNDFTKVAKMSKKEYQEWKKQNRPKKKFDPFEWFNWPLRSYMDMLKYDKEEQIFSERDIDA